MAVYVERLKDIKNMIYVNQFLEINFMFHIDTITSYKENLKKLPVQSNANKFLHEINFLTFFLIA